METPAPVIAKPDSQDQWMDGRNLSDVGVSTSRSGLTGAVIHSFDGSASELQSFLAFDRLFIGVRFPLMFPSLVDR